MRKTTVLGFNMERQASRRRLVVAIYAILALMVAAGWIIDRLNTTGIYIYFAAMFVNWRVLGGYGTDGLIKPFTGKGPKNAPVPSNLVELELRLAGVPIDRNTDEYRNDERELARRDRVHYQAYAAVTALLCPIWLIAQWQIRRPSFIPAGLLPGLLAWFALPAIIVAITLPQAILLWTDPDMEKDLADEAALAASR